MPFGDNQIEKVREFLPAVKKFIYMNTGSVGPLPECTLKEMEKAQQNELRNGRIGSEAFLNKKKVKVETRKLLAEIFNADHEEIALIHNTTEGINLVISAINWQPGDEIITTDAEHGAVLLPLLLLRQRYGVEIKIASIKDNPVNAIKDQITSKTRLIAISHVSFSSGEQFPVAEIASLSHQHGIPLLVDGAQAAGAISVDFKALGVDYYSLPGQKWLCGPEGTGALYIKKDRLDGLQQTFIGLGSVENYNHIDGFDLKSSAQRFEIASEYIPAIYGFKKSLEWFRDFVDPKWAFSRIKELSEMAGRELAKVKGVTVLTPDKKSAGLLSFKIDRLEPAIMVEVLAQKGIIIRKITELNCVRASLGFFNTEEEIEKLVEAVASAV